MCCEPDLAQNVLDAGTVPLLVLCIQEPEITLKRISASAMSDVCKHTPELAQAVVDAGAVAYLSPLIMHPDSKLKRQVGPGTCDTAQSDNIILATVLEQRRSQKNKTSRSVYSSTGVKTPQLTARWTAYSTKIEQARLFISLLSSLLPVSRPQLSCIRLQSSLVTCSSLPFYTSLQIRPQTNRCVVA